MGGKVRRVYEEPRTPYQRLLELGTLKPPSSGRWRSVISHWIRWNCGVIWIDCKQSCSKRANVKVWHPYPNTAGMDRRCN